MSNLAKAVALLAVVMYLNFVCACVLLVMAVRR